MSTVFYDFCVFYDIAMIAQAGDIAVIALGGDCAIDKAAV